MSFLSFYLFIYMFPDPHLLQGFIRKFACPFI